MTPARLQAYEGAEQIMCPPVWRGLPRPPQLAPGGGRYTFRSAWTRGAPCWGRGTRAPWTRCRRWPPAQAAAKPRSRSSTRTWQRSRPPARQTLQARAAPSPVGMGGRGLGCERGAPGSGRSPGRCGCSRRPSKCASSLPAALRRGGRPHCITPLRQHRPLHALHGWACGPGWRACLACPD